MTNRTKTYWTINRNNVERSVRTEKNLSSFFDLGQSRKCNCDLCKRGRRYYRNTAKLPKAERDWMRGFYNAALDAECEAEMAEAAVKSVKGG